MPPKKIISDITKALFPQDGPVKVSTRMDDPKTGGKKKDDDDDIVEEEEDEDEEEEDEEEEDEDNEDDDDDTGVGATDNGEGEGVGTGVGEEGDEDGNDTTNNKNKKKVDSDNEEGDGDGEGDDKCYAKYIDIDGEIDIDEYFNEEDNKIIKNDRISKPFLTKYEKVRLLSDRTRQLAQGAKPMVKNTSGYSHKDIAKMELKSKLIPLIIERPIPNVGTEKWKLSELEIND
jgi:DNA-directed RNA polymerase I, II, and III subunit RPABC2